MNFICIYLYYKSEGVPRKILSYSKQTNAHTGKATPRSVLAQKALDAASFHVGNKKRSCVCGEIIH